MKFFTFLLLVLGLTACSKKTLSHEQFLSEHGYWDYAYAGAFADGGSTACGFFNEHGEVLYLWAQAWPSSEGKNVFYLKRRFTDPAQVEILPGSELETKVLHLLETCRNNELLTDYLPDLDKMKEAIQFRDRPSKQLLTREEKVDTSFYGTYEASGLEPVDRALPALLDDEFVKSFKKFSGVTLIDGSSFKGKVTITSEKMKINGLGRMVKISEEMNYTKEGAFLLGQLTIKDKTTYYPFYIQDENTLFADGLTYKRIK